ncbi:hypothetical protein TSOC_013004 [Tetrabaena socialis]|uniref:Chromo domain-containing protein n=1 Tax=Tetrabaena socialis TaxID=47790 RepID=A0A2J7ZLI1_9CHLO|nr:hypothetical protein TSOC_013004 [Tetrabaena socialis]|eukprot:PNH01124.1 hypothetical protein TSOC_013004 [Tetrabaena socialis]
MTINAPERGAKQRRPHFKPGDRVRLLPRVPGGSPTEDGDGGPSPGPVTPFSGPFTITGVITSQSFSINLAADWDNPLSSVVHVSQLAPWDPPASKPGLASHPITTYVLDGPDDDSDGEVDSVVGVRLGLDRKSAKKACLFRVRWNATRARPDSWEPYSAVAHLPAVRAFLRSDQFREFKASDPGFCAFQTTFPERAPRTVRFALDE